MPLPEPILDDLRFQRDLVDEARRRIIRYCPEWTDYNLSDPGITLIELFAWMTELLTYRLNRVPDKMYIKFLQLLGVTLQPASSARVPLTFWLSAPFPLGPEDTTTAVVPLGTEIATRQTEEQPEIIFTTDQRLTVVPPKLVELRRAPDITRNYLPRLGIESFFAFGDDKEPQEGDTFYLGFNPEQSLSGHILRLTFHCDQTQATGIRRDNPPLVWECSTGEGTWDEVIPSQRIGERDTTGGLNNPQGSLVFYLPLTLQPDQFNGRLAYWLRCRFEQRSEEQGRYSQSPRITQIMAHTMGSSVLATHAQMYEMAALGTSTGEPGQIFQLPHAPILPPGIGETLEVEELRDGEPMFVPWERVENFAYSDRFSRHFTLDTATGEIALGPSIRQSDGTLRAYGRMPEVGRELRFSQYRVGGGAAGNVPESRLQVLKTALPYISRVTNLQQARGGRDAEHLEEAMMRARREMRAQERAITAEDFESLTLRASRKVARVRCRTAGSAPTLPPGTIELLIVPAAFDAVRNGELHMLQVQPELRDEVLAYLNQRRMLTTVLQIREPHYLGVQVKAEVVAAQFTDVRLVQERVELRLQQFLSPLAWEEDVTFSEQVGHTWEGWPFGRALYLSELFSIVQQVPGVRHVLDVQIAYREITPREDINVTTELTRLDGRVLTITEDTLLCSLTHNVEVTTL